jgi:hypothetical protein
MPPEEVDEVRIVSAWAAEHGPPTLELEPPPDAAALERFALRATSDEDRPTDSARCPGVERPDPGSRKLSERLEPLKLSSGT